MNNNHDVLIKALEKIADMSYWKTQVQTKPPLTVEQVADFCIQQARDALKLVKKGKQTP